MQASEEQQQQQQYPQQPDETDSLEDRVNVPQSDNTSISPAVSVSTCQSQLQSQSQSYHNASTSIHSSEADPLFISRRDTEHGSSELEEIFRLVNNNNNNNNNDAPHVPVVYNYWAEQDVQSSNSDPTQQRQPSTDVPWRTEPDVQSDPGYFYSSPSPPLWHDPIRSPILMGRRRHYQRGDQDDTISDLGESVASSGASSNSSSSIIRRRTRRLGRPTSGVPETIEEQSSSNRLRASLDAGMVRLRRWIRAHNAPSSRPVPTPRTSATADDMYLHRSTTIPMNRQRALSEPEGIQMRDLLNDPRYSTEEFTIPPDPNREARTRWVRINRRFQLTITIVALIFSFLLFGILVCWVAMTSTYVVAIDKKCDVPLKRYFWLATLQLILDVFRTDIMRLALRWEVANSSNEQIPFRVIVYNIAYLIYALLVLRLGVNSVYLNHDTTCPTTAPELFKATTVYISLSVAAWSTIILGYLVPFCFVATLLTWNGYTPASDINREPRIIGPAAYSREGAPPGTIHLLRQITEIPDAECCICMGEFDAGQAIVATECDHLFHKACCQEWLRQARTCPVCRTDIPSSYEPEAAAPVAAAAAALPFPGRQEFQQEVVNILRIWRPGAEGTGVPLEATIARLPADEEEGASGHAASI
jgi:hypothetical protein